MSLAVLESIQETVNDPALKEAMSHPEWEAAYEELSQDMDLPFRKKAVDDELMLLYMLMLHSFSVVDGNLRADTRNTTYSYVWCDGEWTTL